MASYSQAAVTPAGIRDGDPVALGALVERRANAVLAYCETVCAPQDAERAAAEAFARFRAAVASAEDPGTLDPERLLLGATRHAAASLTQAPKPSPPAPGFRGRLGGSRGTGASETCALVPDLLAARAEGALGVADQERLARHLERHETCRSLADTVDCAENFYASPPARTVPIGALTEIMLAFAAAAPNVAVPAAELDLVELVPASAAPDEPEPPAPPQSPPGAPAPPAEPPGPLRARPPSPEAIAPPPPPEPPSEAPEPPSEALAPPASPSPDPPPTVPLPDAPLPPEPPPAAAPGAFAPLAAPAVSEPPVPAPPAGPPVAEAEQPYRYEGEGAVQRTMVLPALPMTTAPPAGTGGGVAHPRVADRHRRLPSAGEHGIVYRYVLPGASIAVALLGAMAVAGFFGADAPPARPAAAPVPAAPPAGAPPVAPETNVDIEERAVLVAERKARRERAAAAERRRALRAAAAAAAPVAPAGTVPETTPPAAVTPKPDPVPAPAATPRTPEKASTVEKEPPASSSSALPDRGTTTATTPGDPGGSDGTPTPP